ncbi:MAG TPA: T9SS type A sorting domain-containing protein, partial [Saprospiraceae bacterium]|nr:T9SS type A sorting domain-containing protein [Saprospiraceae bacterium]
MKFYIISILICLNRLILLSQGWYPLTGPTNLSKIYLKNKSDIFCETSQSLEMSNDDGRTWKIINGDLPLPRKLLFFSDGNILVASEGKLLLSKDLGSNWEDIQYPSTVFIDASIKVYITSKDEILLPSYNDSIYSSVDKGITWTARPTAIGFNYRNYRLSINDVFYTSLNRNTSTCFYSLDLGKSLNSFNISVSSPFTESIILTNKNYLIYSHGSELIFTKDFGNTFDTLIMDKFSTLMGNDAYGNCYIFNGVNKHFSGVLNIYTKSLIHIDMNELLDRSNNAFWNIQTGENGYLYAFIKSLKIHKNSQFINKPIGQISGNIVLDENLNCKKDSNEKIGFPYQIAFKDQNNFTYNFPMEKNGSFNGYLYSSNYQMQLPNSNTLWQECNFPKNIQINDNDSVRYNDQVVKPIQWCSDIRVNSTLGRLRRCFDNNLAYIFIKNYGSKNAKDVKVKLIIDDYFDNIVASFPPSFQQGRIFEFIIPEIKITETYTIYFTFKVSCNAQLNQVHCIKALVDNVEQCNHILPLSDTILSCEKNIGSFDPNDKMAYSSGMPLSNKITSEQEYIEYLIRFQNTGTDTTFKVVLRDQLDKNLDWNSFEVLSSSHPYSFTMDDGGLVTFLFKDILLPDSSINVVASNGYIKYSIKKKDNIALGTVIHNEAAIYFDFNEPVWTNKVSLQLVSPSKTKNYSQDILLTIVPNPFSTKASISLPKELEDQEKLIKIFDLHGKEITQFKSMEKSIELINDHFTNGIYLVKVFAKNGRTGIAKFVV